MQTLKCVLCVMVLTLVLAGTVLGQSVEQLPLNGRSFQQLLVPGQELSVTNQVRSFQTVAGAHQYVLEGAGMQESIWQENSVIRPPGLESLQEYNAELKAFPAKDTSTTSVVMSTKSGADKSPSSRQ